MPVKSAFTGSNASVMPIAESGWINGRREATLNRGSSRSTVRHCAAAIQFVS